MLRKSPIGKSLRGPAGASLITLLLLLGAPASSHAAAAATERVSVSSTGTQGDSESSEPSVSADGRYVAFFSEASNLVPGSNAFGVFVRDRATNETQLAGRNSSGTPIAAENPALSADGRHVAFTSFDDDGQILVRDLTSDTTELASQSSSGHPGNSFSDNATISANGRYVAFSSDATNLTPLNPKTRRNEFVRDLNSGTTRQVNVSSGGKAGNGDCHKPSISANGRFVAFESKATNLVPGAVRGWQIYLRDLVKHRTTLISKSSAGKAANGTTRNAAISGDGRYVAFSSQATNLIRGDSNHTWDVFRRDRVAGKTKRFSVSSGGKQGNGESRYPAISNHGGYIAFESKATNLVKGDTNRIADAFLHTAGGQTKRVSVSTTGAQANGPVFPFLPRSVPAISADGRFVGFDSTASNLVAGDTNGSDDVFLRGPLH
jgi:Tol biopolymer transport system component